MSEKKKHSPTPPKRNVRRATGTSPTAAQEQSPFSHSGAESHSSGAESHSSGAESHSSGAESHSSDAESHIADVLPIEYKTHYQNIQTLLPNLDDFDFLLAYQQQLKYKFKNQIGTGTFSDIYEVEFEVENVKYPLAIKVLKSSHDFTYDETIHPRDYDFAGTLQENPHSNILEIIDFFRSDDWLRYYIVTELAETDLSEAVKEENVWKPLKEYNCRHLIRGIAEGVQHLHSIGLAHCDIKLENVLLFPIPVAQKNEAFFQKFYKYIPKLADFGQLRDFDQNDPNDPRRFFDQPLCSIQTAAPESWFSTTKFDVIKADIFSVGALLLSLLLGAHPYDLSPEYMTKTGIIVTSEQLCNNKKKNIVFTEQLCQSFGVPLKVVLLRLLDPNPQNRISIQEFLADVWIKNTTPPQSFEDSYAKPPKPKFFKEA